MPGCCWFYPVLRKTYACDNLSFMDSVVCGLFGVQEDFIEDDLSLDRRFIQNPVATFFFRAFGESMSPLILPGDLLIVDRSKKVQSGAIVVASFQGEMICKRYLKTSVGIILRSEKSDWKDLVIESLALDELTLFGPVISLVRELKVG